MPGNPFQRWLRPRWPLGQWCAPLKRHFTSRPYCVFCHGLWGLIAATLFFLIAAWIRLLFGPVSLGPFASAVSGALADALPPGLSMTYDRAEVEWAREEGGVTLAVLGSNLRESDGTSIVQAPKAYIDLALAPLLEGRFSVQRVALVGAKLTVVHTRLGHWRLGNDDTLLDRLRERFSTPGEGTSLKRFAVRRADLAIRDEVTGIRIAATDAELRLNHPKKAPGDLDLRLKMALAVGGQPAQMVANIHLPKGAAPSNGDVTVKGLQLSALATGKYFSALRHAPLATDIAAHFVSLSGHLLWADASLSAKGQMNLPSVQGPVLVRNLSLAARYDGATQQLRIRDARITADRIQGHLQGMAQLTRLPDGGIASIATTLQADNIALDLPGLYGAPVSYGSAALKAVWQSQSQQLDIRELKTSGTAFAIQAAGQVNFSGATPAVDVQGSLAAMSVRDLVRYWPLPVAHGARAWIDRSMPSGRVGPFAFTIHLPAGTPDTLPLPHDAISLSFPIENATAEYLKGLTPMTEARGSALLTGTDFTVTVRSMKVGPLAVTGGRFYVPDINAATQIGQVDVHLQGGVSDVLKLIDMKPLGYPTRFGIAPSAASGAAQVALKLDIPLHHDVSVDAIRIDVGVETKGLGLALGPHFKLTDGAVAFAVRNTGLHATGTTGIGGSSGRLSLDWTEDFRSRQPVSTHIAVKGVLDAAARRSLNLHTDGYIRGPVLISGSFTGSKGALRQGDLTLDLTPATVTVDAIGLAKPAGFAITGHMGLMFGPHTQPSAASFRLNGQGISVIANTQFAADGSLTALQMPVFHIGQKNDFALYLTHNAQMTDIQVQGRLFDGSRLMRHGTDEPDAALDEQASSLRLTAKVDKVLLRNNVVVNGLDLDFATNGSRLASLHLAGTMGKSALQGSLSQNIAGRTVVVRIGDAGQLLKGLYGVAGLHGGKIDMTAFFPGRATDPPSHDSNAPDFKGKLVMKDFTAVDQPFLARLFTAGSLGGMVNLMQGEGIAIDMLEMPFVSRNNVISIQDMRAVGPAIGLTGEGYIDRPQGQIALKGTLVPLYGLNSVLGVIPLIGDVLTSKKGEGIFGMSYTVRGNVEEPSISVNPLSVLAPGILRRLFEGRPLNALQAPSNNPQKAPVTKKTVR